MQNMDSILAMIAAARSNRANATVDAPEISVEAPLNGTVWHEKQRSVSAHNLTNEHSRYFNCCGVTVIKSKGKPTEGFLAPNIRQTVWGRHNPNSLKV